jgi:hypothetical protein
MQVEVVRTDVFVEEEAGRESEDICLLARFFSGFAKLDAALDTAALGAPGA